MQAAAATFADEPLGHNFVLRKPLAKATANKCAECGADIRSHARSEVTDEQLLLVLNAQDDGKASFVLPGELAVGSYKAAMASCKAGDAAIVNCAGQLLHDFMPMTRGPFDIARKAKLLHDVEWQDSEDFDIAFADIERALAWAREHVAAGRPVIVNCAQGKSRSGTMAVAYVVAKLKLPVGEALRLVQARRPLVQPNPTFMRALHAFESRLLQLPAPVTQGEALAIKAHALYDADASGGLNLAELRSALVKNGLGANLAQGVLEEYDADQDGELSAQEWTRAWLAVSEGAVPAV